MSPKKPVPKLKDLRVQVTRCGSSSLAKSSPKASNVAAPARPVPASPEVGEDEVQILAVVFCEKGTVTRSKFKTLQQEQRRSLTGEMPMEVEVQASSDKDLPREVSQKQQRPRRQKKKVQPQPVVDSPIKTEVEAEVKDEEPDPDLIKTENDGVDEDDPDSHYLTKVPKKDLPLLEILQIPPYICRQVPQFKPIGSRKRLQSAIEMVRLETSRPDYDEKDEGFSLYDLDDLDFGAFSEDVKEEVSGIVEDKDPDITFMMEVAEESIPLKEIKIPDTFNLEDTDDEADTESSQSSQIVGKKGGLSSGFKSSNGNRSKNKDSQDREPAYSSFSGNRRYDKVCTGFYNKVISKNTEPGVVEENPPDCQLVEGSIQLVDLAEVKAEAENENMEVELSHQNEVREVEEGLQKQSVPSPRRKSLSPKRTGFFRMLGCKVGAQADNIPRAEATAVVRKRDDGLLKPKANMSTDTLKLKPVDPRYGTKFSRSGRLNLYDNDTGFKRRSVKNWEVKSCDMGLGSVKR